MPPRRVSATRLPSGIGDASRVAADAALDGARGNSGAIFAQFLHGLAESFRDRPHVSTSEFATAAGKGSEAAYLALQEPREGTILSVLRAWAHDLKENADEHDDFVEALGRALAAARRALADTPKQLAVLARSHVVDAGGQGFVYFLEGVLESLRSDEPVEWPLHELPDDAPPVFAAAHADVDETYRFCSEALIAGDGLDRSRGDERRGTVRRLDRGRRRRFADARARAHQRAAGVPRRRRRVWARSSAPRSTT